MSSPARGVPALALTIGSLTRKVLAIALLSALLAIAGRATGVQAASSDKTIVVADKSPELIYKSNKELEANKISAHVVDASKSNHDAPKRPEDARRKS